MTVRNAEFKKGQIFKTKGQVKKHYTQCTKTELAYLEILLKSLGSLKLSSHAKKKDITINMDDIKKALKDNNLKNTIIEYNETNGDKRVLIRSKERYLTNVNNQLVYCNLCFVVSLIKKEVITAYYNSTKDNHDNVDLRRYNKNLQIY